MRKFYSVIICSLLTVAAACGSTFEKSSGYDPFLPVNKILFKHWQEKNIRVPAVSSDGVFIRRVALTAAGRLPTAAEVRDFVFDDTPGKRAKLIEKFLNSPEYADMQAMRFADMLRIKSEFPINLWPNAVQLYHRTIHDELLTDRSLKSMFYDLLTASGSNFRTAHANFFRASADRSPTGLAKMVLLTTMNMRETEFSKSELEDFAKLFSLIRYKSTYEWKEEIVYNDPVPQVITARLPDGTAVTIDSGATDPRKVFADWLLQDDNPYFARAVTNKVWYWAFGRGIYPQADDLPRLESDQRSFWAKLWGSSDSSTAKGDQPFCRELQDYMIAEFQKSNYSLKHLYRLIMNSAAFQASAVNQDEELLKNFAAYPVRRLESELLIDALAAVTKGYDRYMSVIPEPFTYLPGSSKAVNIADGSISSGTLDSFGRPPRDSGQFSERNKASTDSQGLYLMNSAALYRRLNNYCRNLQRNYRNDNERLDRIYLDILSRYPTNRERQVFKKYQTSLDKKSRHLVWSDTVWVLFNSKEFIFYH